MIVYGAVSICRSRRRYNEFTSTASLFIRHSAAYIGEKIVPRGIRQSPWIEIRVIPLRTGLQQFKSAGNRSSDLKNSAPNAHRYFIQEAQLSAEKARI